MNVPYEMLEIISDCKHLEVLGFHLPELARNVALQEDRYRRHSVSLTAMVDRFSAVLACMTDPEVSRRGRDGALCPLILVFFVCLLGCWLLRVFLRC